MTRPRLLEGQAAIAFGAMAGIILIGIAARLLMGEGLSYSPLLALPIGASAVLVFAVSASPLAQPRGVIGGNLVSALIGVAVGYLIPLPLVAAGVAVGLAIWVMILLKCLHPPGGAMALGGALLARHDLASSLHYVALAFICSVLMVLCGWLWVNRTGKTYPHRAPPPAPVSGFSMIDIDRALARYGELLDVSPDDLAVLFADVERRAHDRLHGRLTCGEVMNPDDQAAPGAVMVEETTPVETLLPTLSGGEGREAAVTNRDGEVIGRITQTDLLRVLYRAHLVETLDARR